MEATATQNKIVLAQNTLDIDFIKKQFFPPTASPKDVEYCLKVAQTLGLNPIKREIFFIERSSKVNGQWITKIEPLTSRDGFLSIAHRTGNFAGIESYCELKEVPKLINGVWQNATDLVATAKAYRKDTNIPTIVEVEFSEYAQYKKSGELTQFWAKMPKTMLKKVAESQALRKAFNISGIYGVEEMGVGHAEGGELKIDEEAVKNEENVITPETIPETTQEEVSVVDNIRQTLQNFGMDIQEKNGFLRVIEKTKGAIFKNRNILKKLGFKFHGTKKIWWKKVA